ncbi:MAG: prepilin-type N-terminal cleavage/methylation domain-containing protein [Candidatus Acidiferrales bacterium]
MPKPIPTHARALPENSGDGFSLIELLIVVAIILIITAIAVPNFIRAKVAANQSAAIENCRTITTTEILYYTSYGIGYAPSLNALGGPVTGLPSATNAQLIDDVLSTGARSGYNFTYVPLGADPTGAFQGFSLSADPQIPAYTGVNHYFTDQPLVIHYNSTSAATASDPAIQ